MKFYLLLLTVSSSLLSSTFDCVFVPNEELRCSGNNHFGQLNVPRKLGPVIAFAKGDNHACAISAQTKIVVCWGLGRHGQTNIPSDLGPAKSIHISGDHTCVLEISGQKVCWGPQSYNDL